MERSEQKSSMPPLYPLVHSILRKRQEVNARLDASANTTHDTDKGLIHKFTATPVP